MNQPESEVLLLINNETYKVQQLEFEDETFFFVKGFDEIVCMIMQDENGEWEPDCEVGQELIKHIKKCIDKFSR